MLLLAATTTAGPGDFVAYGPSHWAVLIAVALAGAVLVAVGRGLRNTPGERWLSRGLAALMLATDLGFQAYSMLPQHWDVKHSLPLELCDLAWMAAVIGLWTRTAWVCRLVYYWGLTLTLQALLTPRLHFDFPRVEFVMFFATHSLTVIAALYLTWGTGRARPTWSGWAMTCLVTMVWAVLMLGFNWLTGANYLFVSDKPVTSSLLDYLGPWPYYLLAEATIGLAVWAMITWPWYWWKAVYTV